MEYAVNVCPNEVIQKEHLPKNLLLKPHASSLTNSHEETESGNNGLQSLENSESLKNISASGPVGWGEVERDMILKSLTKTGGNRTKAAELLGWSRSKLWRKIKHHGLE